MFLLTHFLNQVLAFSLRLHGSTGYQVGKGLKNHLVQPSLAKAHSRQDDSAPCQANLVVPTLGNPAFSWGYSKGWMFSLWNQHSTSTGAAVNFYTRFSSTQNVAASSFCLPSAEVPCAALHSSSFKPEEQHEERREDKYTAMLSCHHKYLYCEKYHKIIPTVLEKAVLAL